MPLYNIIIIFWFYCKKGINESIGGGGGDIKFNNIRSTLCLHFYGHLQPDTINNVFTSKYCDVQS